jgi:hypothetical protein
MVELENKEILQAVNDLIILERDLIDFPHHSNQLITANYIQDLRETTKKIRKNLRDYLEGEEKSCENCGNLCEESIYDRLCEHWEEIREG